MSEQSPWRTSSFSEDMPTDSATSLMFSGFQTDMITNNSGPQSLEEVLPRIRSQHFQELTRVDARTAQEKVMKGRSAC